MSSAASPDLAEKKSWSSRSVGAAWQQRFFYYLIRFGGRRPAYTFLYPLIAYYIVCRPDQRRKTAPYLKRRFPGRHGFQALADSYRLLLNFARSLVDRALAGILGPQSLQSEFPEADKLRQLAADDRGLIIVTSHVGCWQAAMIYLSHLGKPVHLLIQQEEGNIDRHFFELKGEKNPFNFIDPTGFLGGSLEMTEALRRGEVVCIMGDRHQGSDATALSHDFLGASVKFPLTPWKLAAVTGAAAAVLFPLRRGPSRYLIELAAVIRLQPEQARPAAALQPGLAAYVQALEELTTKEPYQFFNFYDMWEGQDLN